MKRIGVTLLLILLICSTIAYFFNKATHIKEPAPSDLSALELERVEIDQDFYKIGKNWLRKSESGLWEMYIEGDAFERGVVHGKLAQEMIVIQERAFIAQINEMVSSTFYLRFLKHGIAWFNRNIEQHIPKEYQLEILGISKYSPTEFDYIAPNYQRVLNYHAAHDIGHALQNMNMVGCTSFAAWDEMSVDSSLIIGRNFDFNINDQFAEQKIVYFVNPKEGHKHAFITWPGMIGAVSGMNEKGLSITLNAAKSSIPTEAATPVSILAREILQYAENIDEAYEIAKNRKTFVSETLLIGSAEDSITVIIEKTPEKIDLFKSSEHKLICTNHFQSDSLKNDSLNLSSIQTTDTKYRYERTEELIAQDTAMSVLTAAKILRNQKGKENKNLGMGNEMAINQLAAHHSIIFKPEQGQFWISTDPWQLGKYVAYDMGKIFSDSMQVLPKQPITETELTIPADKFLETTDYKEFLLWKSLKKVLQHATEADPLLPLEDTFNDDFIQSNPEFYLTYSMLGDYYIASENCEEAVKYYKRALERKIPNIAEENRINQAISDCEL